MTIYYFGLRYPYQKLADILLEISKFRNVLIERMQTKQFLNKYGKDNIRISYDIPADLKIGDCVAIELVDDKEVLLFWLGAWR